jgi:hypothetical protein
MSKFVVLIIFTWTYGFAPTIRDVYSHFFDTKESARLFVAKRARYYTEESCGYSEFDVSGQSEFIVNQYKLIYAFEKDVSATHLDGHCEFEIREIKPYSEEDDEMNYQ